MTPEHTPTDDLQDPQPQGDGADEMDGRSRDPAPTPRGGMSRELAPKPRSGMSRELAPKPRSGMSRDAGPPSTPDGDH